MGLKDRDYYWERHYPPKAKLESSFKYLWMPVFVITVLALFAGKQLIGVSSEQTPQVISNQPALKQTQGGLILYKDQQGHFRGTVRVNGVSMPFLIDTGATRTVIPKLLARKARLPFGERIISNTAGGKITSRKTTISQMKIGNVTLTNTPATINSHLKEVLIGMNTLKFFKMTLDGNKLELKVNGYHGNLASNGPVSHQNAPSFSNGYNPPQRTQIIKRVNCRTENGRKSCTTSFGDR